MDLRSKLEVSSTWECPASLQNVLYLSNQSGNVLEEPTHSEKAAPVVLSRAVGGEGEGGGVSCFLHIRRLARLRGYSLHGVGVVSGARIVEIYRGDEYIATSKGAVVDDEARIGGKLYECGLVFPRDTYDHLALKLLSLKGKTQVPITRLTLTLAEDYGGEETGHSGVTPQSNPADLVSSLPPLPSNAPPFLQGLISSLHQWQQSGHSPQAVNPRSSENPASLDLLQMMSALREIRPATSAAEPKSDTSEHPEEEAEEEATRGDEESKGHASSPSSIEAFVEQRLAELESRMRSYVDSKVVEIMEYIDKKGVANVQNHQVETDHEH